MWESGYFSNLEYSGGSAGVSNLPCCGGSDDNNNLGVTLNVIQDYVLVLVTWDDVEKVLVWVTWDIIGEVLAWVAWDMGECW